MSIPLPGIWRDSGGKNTRRSCNCLGAALPPLPQGKELNKAAWPAASSGAWHCLWVPPLATPPCEQAKHEHVKTTVCEENGKWQCPDRKATSTQTARQAGCCHPILPAWSTSLLASQKSAVINSSQAVHKWAPATAELGSTAKTTPQPLCLLISPWDTTFHCPPPASQRLYKPFILCALLYLQELLLRSAHTPCFPCFSLAGCMMPLSSLCEALVALTRVGALPLSIVSYPSTGASLVWEHPSLARQHTIVAWLFFP